MTIGEVGHAHFPHQEVTHATARGCRVIFYFTSYKPSFLWNADHAVTISTYCALDMPGPQAVSTMQT